MAYKPSSARLLVLASCCVSLLVLLGSTAAERYCETTLISLADAHAILAIVFTSRNYGRPT